MYVTIGRPFVKRFSCGIGLLSVCLSVCLSVTVVYCGQTVGCIKMKLGMEIGLDPRPHYVRWGSSCPLPNRGIPPIFSAHVCCDQTAGWIKVPLGTGVGLGQGEIVLDGDPAPPKEGHSPHFSAHVYCGHTAGWIKMPLGTEGGLGPGHIVSDGDPAAPKGIQPPQFSAHVFVAIRSPISATAEHLF